MIAEKRGLKSISRTIVTQLPLFLFIGFAGTIAILLGQYLLTFSLFAMGTSALSTSALPNESKSIKWIGIILNVVFVTGICIATLLAILKISIMMMLGEILGSIIFDLGSSTFSTFLICGLISFATLFVISLVKILK